MNLQVPSHLLSSSKFMGIAVCAVFIFRSHHPLHQFDTHMLSCHIMGDGCNSFGPSIWFSTAFGKIESYNLCLEYFAYEDLGSNQEEKLNRVDANEFTQIKVTFETLDSGLEVTKCGAHLIFEQDIEDLKQTKPGSSSCIITPYHEDDDLGGDLEKDTKIKEIRDDEPPHPKWTEHPNLIENWIGNLCIQGQADSDCE